MTYHNAIKFIKNSPNSIPPQSSGAERISRLCESLGNPQKKIKYIRLTGSNGKTVTARMLISILGKAGIANGCLSMPIYEEIRDNIRINGEPISMEETVRYTEHISQAVTDINKQLQDSEDCFRPTTHEIMLCIALLAFTEHRCDVCILEGDHSTDDPSRFLPSPFAAVICGRIPSNDTSEITKIRSYICRGIREIISVPQNQDAYKIISDTCFSANCRLTLPARNKFEINRLTLRGTEFSYKDNDYSLRLCGKFQTVNALTAIETSEMLVRCGYKITSEHIRNGLASVIAPCKFELLSMAPTIIADSTHSSVAIGAVCDSLADFKEIIGTKIRLCLPEGELIPQYVDALQSRGYSIEKISSLSTADTIAKNTEYPIPISVHKTVKIAVRDTLNELSSDSILLISGDSNFTKKIRYELLATLGF